MSYRFCLIGAAGYIAPRHLEAIKNTGNDLVAYYDINDSVGIVDKYFPKAKFFKEFEFFYDYVNSLKDNEKIDYMSICSPNYLHYPHVRFGLNSGSNVICEKPLLKDSKSVREIEILQKQTGKKVFSILQLRYHEEVKRIKNIISESENKMNDIQLTYITSRGNWYLESWKNEFSKSFGLLSNIGIHFFDLLEYIFGDVLRKKIFVKTEMKASGFIEYEKANVKWFLSIDSSDLNYTNSHLSTFRELKIGKETFNFNVGFENLHLKSYQEILKGRGFGLMDCHNSIRTVELLNISNLSKPEAKEIHPFLKI